MRPRAKITKKSTGHSLPFKWEGVVFVADQSARVSSGLGIDWNVWNFVLFCHVLIPLVSAIKKATSAANGFYWRSALKLSDAISFKGLETADPQSSPMGI